MSSAAILVDVKHLLQIRGAVAEYERSLIAERMRRGRRMKMEAGLLLPWTTPPFGYRMHPDRPRDPSGVWIEPAEAATVADMFGWYAEEGRSLFGLAKRLQECGVCTPRGRRRWNDSTIRGILTNPTYTGTVYIGRSRYRLARIRRSAVQPLGRPANSYDRTPQAEWTPVATIPAIVGQDLFDRVQAKLTRNRSFAPRNNTKHPYLLRALVSCGLCHLSCVGRWEGAARKGYAYYTCKGKGHALNSGRDEKCQGRFIPVQQLDDLVWADLCAVLMDPGQVTQALERAHAGTWGPQELHARRETVRKGRTRLMQQTERLTEAYLGMVIPLDEYRRRRGEIDERLVALDEQARQLEAQATRHADIAGLAHSLTDFCARVRQGLAQATFAQKRQLVELLIDRVVVTGEDVEIRYVFPTTPQSEQVRFCYLRADYFQAQGQEPILDDILLLGPPFDVGARQLGRIHVGGRRHDRDEFGLRRHGRGRSGDPALPIPGGVRRVEVVQPCVGDMRVSGGLRAGPAQVAHEGDAQVDWLTRVVGQRQCVARGGDLAHERPVLVVLERHEGADVGEGGEASVLIGAQHSDHVAAIAG